MINNLSKEPCAIYIRTYLLYNHGDLTMVRGTPSPGGGE